MDSKRIENDDHPFSIRFLSYCDPIHLLSVSYPVKKKSAHAAKNLNEGERVVVSIKSCNGKSAPRSDRRPESCLLN